MKGASSKSTPSRNARPPARTGGALHRPTAVGLQVAVSVPAPAVPWLNDKGAEHSARGCSSEAKTTGSLSRRLASEWSPFEASFVAIGHHCTRRRAACADSPSNSALRGAQTNELHAACRSPRGATLLSAPNRRCPAVTRGGGQERVSGGRTGRPLTNSRRAFYASWGGAEGLPCSVALRDASEELQVGPASNAFSAGDLVRGSAKLATDGRGVARELLGALECLFVEGVLGSVGQVLHCRFDLRVSHLVGVVGLRPDLKPGPVVISSGSPV